MSSNLRRLKVIGLAPIGAFVALFAVIGVLAVVPTLVHSVLEGYGHNKLFSSTSPDGQYRVDGFVRVDIPTNEILDPSGTVRITLWDSRTGEALDQLFVGLYEADDFQEPKILWQADGTVQIQEMERNNHHLSATLNAHAWDVPK